MRALEAGKSARSVECTEEEAEILSTVSLLTNKPIIFAANMSEDDFRGGVEKQQILPGGPGVRQGGARRGAAHLRRDRGGDLRHGPGGESAVFKRHGAGRVPAWDRLIQACYSLLGADFLPDCRQAGSPGLGPSRRGTQGSPGRRQDPLRTSSGASSGGGHWL